MEPMETSESTKLLDVWPGLSPEERVERFLSLPPEEQEPFFLERQPLGHAHLLLGMPAHLRRMWMRLLAPDDAADAIRQMPEERRQDYLELLDEPTRREVLALLAFSEAEAGGLMSRRSRACAPT